MKPLAINIYKSALWNASLWRYSILIATKSMLRSFTQIMIVWGFASLYISNFDFVALQHIDLTIILMFFISGLSLFFLYIYILVTITNITPFLNDISLTLSYSKRVIRFSMNGIVSGVQILFWLLIIVILDVRAFAAILFVILIITFCVLSNYFSRTKIRLIASPQSILIAIFIIFSIEVIFLFVKTNINLHYAFFLVLSVRQISGQISIFFKSFYELSLEAIRDTRKMELAK
jgi:hypothetical protein